MKRKPHLTIELDKSLIKSYKELCKKNDTNMSRRIRKFIKEELQKSDLKEAK